MSHAEEHFEILVRNPRTLAVEGEIPMSTVPKIEWTRNAYSGGSFQITVPYNAISPSLLIRHAVIEIRRHGIQEFLGILERKRYRPKFGTAWNISGPEALGWWLSQRLVGPTAPDDRSGIAEHVACDYLQTYLLTGGYSANAQLSGKTFVVESTSGRGETVNVSATRQWLNNVLEDLCFDGGIMPSLIIDTNGYRFGFTTPVDRTVSAGGTPFSVDMDNVEDLEFDENYSEYKNALYVLGSGSAGSRAYTQVIDADSVSQHFYREGSIDARNADSTAKRTAIGTRDLAVRADALVSVKGKPNRASESAVYREAWNVGDLVTFAEARLRDTAVDTQIVSATVSLNRENGEEITFELGRHNAASQLRRIGEAIRQLRVASFE